jgi:hypothetical protein
MRLPLSGCAASPSLSTREGDDTLAAGRPLLGVPELGRSSLVGRGLCISVGGA